MFTRFSPAAKRVLRAAEQACRNHNHYYVGVEHLLLALLDEHAAALTAELSAAGIPRAAVLAELRKVLGTGEDRLWDGILVTPRVRSVVRAAESASGEGVIEPVDLLRAILAEDGGTAADILKRVAGNKSGSARVAR